MPRGCTAAISQWQEKETNTCAGRACCYMCKRFQFLTRLQDAAVAAFMFVGSRSKTLSPYQISVPFSYYLWGREGLWELSHLLITCLIDNKGG